MTLQQIIEYMEDKIQVCKDSNEPYDKASWQEEIGVIIPWGYAQRIIKVIKDSLDIPPKPSSLPDNATTPTYEWTLDDSELPVNKGDCTAIQQNIAEIEKRISNLETFISVFLKDRLNQIGTVMDVHTRKIDDLLKKS